MKILVTGSREFTDRECVREAFREAVRMGPVPEDVDVGALTTRCVEVIHGGAEGADSLADAIARDYGFAVRVLRPEYDRFGPEIAPLIRNSRLVGERPDLCLAFYSARAADRGTRDCVVKCRAAKIPVREYERP